jgi:hypothetical protein
VNSRRLSEELNETIFKKEGAPWETKPKKAQRLLRNRHS